jgi:hypothetical protein
LYERVSPKFVGAPVRVDLGPMSGTGESDCRASSTGMPGSLTSGIWKSTTPAWRAMSAGTETTWWVATNDPDSNPAARLSPIE